MSRSRLDECPREVEAPPTWLTPPERLETYLDDLEAPLARLSPETRKEWRQEARQHVLCLVEAHQELGAEPEEALELALRQFGEARRIGREVSRETLRRRGRLSHDVLWSLAGFSWNVLAYAALVSLSTTAQWAAAPEPHFWVDCAFLGAAHVICGAALARLPRERLSPPALRFPFVPFLLVNLLLTWEGLRGRGPGANVVEFLGGATICWASLAASLLAAQGWRLAVLRPEAWTDAARAESRGPTAAA